MQDIVEASKIHLWCNVKSKKPVTGMLTDEQHPHFQLSGTGTATDNQAEDNRMDNPPNYSRLESP